MSASFASCWLTRELRKESKSSSGPWPCPDGFWATVVLEVDGAECHSDPHSGDAGWDFGFPLSRKANGSAVGFGALEAAAGVGLAFNGGVADECDEDALAGEVEVG